MAEKDTDSHPIAFSCPVCLEKVVRPKCLPCLHTFCEACLQIFISRSATGKDKQTFEFQCPVCRHVTGCPEPGIPVEEWAKHFPVNVLINAMTSSMDQNDEHKYCAICLRDDKQNKAESWCHECSEAICTSCKRLHQIVSSLQKHKFSPLNLENKDRKLKFPELDEPCHLHQGKYVEVFCLDHEKLCCSVCFATQHRHCQHVEALDEVAKNMRKSVVEWNIAVLSRISKTTREVIAHKEKAIMQANTQKKEILENVSAEIKNIKSRLDEAEQQFEKTYLKTHEDNEEQLKQCVFDMKQYLLTVRNGETLLSAIQQRGSIKQMFHSTVKTINDVEEQFKLYKSGNPQDEENDYEHNHTTMLKQICEHNKIDDVRLLPKPSGAIWNLSKHLSSFRIFEKADEEQALAIFENLATPESLNAEKTYAFQLSTPAQLGIFIDNETLAMVSSSNSLSFYNMEGLSITCNPQLQVKSKTLLCIGQTKDILYMGCMTTIQRLVLKKKNNSISVTCEEKVDVKQEIDAFSVDEEQNRIIIASTTGITIFTLSPAVSIAHTIAFQSPETPLIIAVSKSHDRFAVVIGNEIVCYSVTGEEFRYQHTDLQNPQCLAIDTRNNIYAVYSRPQKCGNCYIVQEDYGYSEFQDYAYHETDFGYGDEENFVNRYCQNCGISSREHVDTREMFQISHDKGDGRSFLSNCPETRFMSFNRNSEKLLISDGQTCTLYKLSVSGFKQ